MSEDRITRVEGQLEAIHTALLGGMDGQPGTIHIVKSMSVRLEKMEQKVDRLETDSTRAKGFIAAAAGMFGAFGTYFLDKFTKP